MFNSQKSTRLSRITVYKLFRSIARAAGLPETLQHPHVLKHTAAMLMVRAGANAFLIRQHLGHRSFDSTLAYVNPIGPRRERGFREGFLHRVLGNRVPVLLHPARASPADRAPVLPGNTLTFTSFVAFLPRSPRSVVNVEDIVLLNVARMGRSCDAGLAWCGIVEG